MIPFLLFFLIFSLLLVEEEEEERDGNSLLCSLKPLIFSFYPPMVVQNNGSEKRVRGFELQERLPSSFSDRTFRFAREAANPCLHPLSYANETDGEVNRSLMGMYSSSELLVTLAMMVRNGGGVSDRRDDSNGDLDTDVFLSSSSESSGNADGAGSSKLM